jgi:hypothetical protein
MSRLKRTAVSAGILTLLLFVAVPAGGAPALQKGDRASYDLSVSVSFLQSCGPIVGSSAGNEIVCPMTATLPFSVNSNGTLGWEVTGLNATTASLNVTRDVSILSGDTSARLSHVTNFNESVNLATRIASILPFIMPEMDQALQMAQTSMASNLPSGASLGSSTSILDSTVPHRPIYTMWWVNGPLKLNQTVPVLVLPTNVTSSSSIDLGGTLGHRTAWTLLFNFSRPILPVDPTVSSLSPIPVGDDMESAFTFNYDQTSDLLLTATANIHLGFGEEMTIPPTPCDSSMSATPCPAPAQPTIIMREIGIDVQASLKLASTTVDMSHPMAQATSSQGGNDGSQSGMGSGSGSSAGTGTGSGTGSGSTTATGSGATGATSGAGQPASNQGGPTSSLQSTLRLPWIYGLLGILAAAVIGAGVWIARGRMKRTATVASGTQLSI